jgi:Thiamine pyrophosphate enzyme, C-terminal TPP binding domain
LLICVNATSGGASGEGGCGLSWATAPSSRVISIDPEAALLDRAMREMGDRLIIGCLADVRTAAKTLIARAPSSRRRSEDWFKEARAAIDDRPAEWASIVSSTTGRLHPAELFRALRPYIERNDDTVLICDGGEIGQWAQSMLPVRRRMINGISGSIGSSLSLALSARYVEPKAPVFAVLGDGTIGFHPAEFETAIRRNLPFVAVVGNDACWNAESQIQLRTYGANRMHNCGLTAARYDLIVAALRWPLVARTLPVPIQTIGLAAPEAARMRSPGRKQIGVSMTSVPTLPSGVAKNVSPVKFCDGSSLISVSNAPPLVRVSALEPLTPAVMLPALMIVVKSNASPFWKSNTVGPKAPRRRGSALHRFALACFPSDPGVAILNCWPFIRRGSGSPERGTSEDDLAAACFRAFPG